MNESVPIMNGVQLTVSFFRCALNKINYSKAQCFMDIPFR